MVRGQDRPVSNDSSPELFYLSIGLWLAELLAIVFHILIIL